MASAGKKTRSHSRNAVYGDLAYDLNREAHSTKQKRHQTPPVKRVHPDTTVQTRPRQRLSLLSVLGSAIVCVLAVLLLMSYIELTEISSDVVTLQNQLTDLKDKQVALTAQYERMFDLDTVRKAAEEAGMSKPSSSQIFYIDLSNGDSVVVHQQSNTGLFGKILDLLDRAVYAVLEYFG